MPTDHANLGLRTAGVGRGKHVAVYVNGRQRDACLGESVLAVLWAEGIHGLHVTGRTVEPRGFYCGIGVCFDCLVTVDGRTNVRACLETVRADMRIDVQRDAGRDHSVIGAPHAPD